MTPTIGGTIRPVPGWYCCVPSSLPGADCSAPPPPPPPPPSSPSCASARLPSPSTPTHRTLSASEGNRGAAAPLPLGRSVVRSGSVPFLITGGIVTTSLPRSPPAQARSPALRSTHSWRTLVG